VWASHVRYQRRKHVSKYDPTALERLEQSTSDRLAMMDTLTTLTPTQREATLNCSMGTGRMPSSVPQMQETIRPVLPSRYETATSRGYSVVGGGVGKMLEVTDWIKLHIDRIMCDTHADAIVVHGTSGTAVAFGLLAQGWDAFPLVMLRKRGEDSHGVHLEALNRGGRVSFGSYVFIDDFTASGGTVRRVKSDIYANMVGLVLYAVGHGRGLSIRGCSEFDGPMYCRRESSGY
jgi:hypothetical protein